MEFNIYDLLDDLPDVDLDIPVTSTGASARRIQELTMKKIHANTSASSSAASSRQRRRLSTLSKVFIAAATVAALAIPAAAATGFHFTDWLEGLFTPSGSYDTDVVLGASGKNWEVSGYLLELSAQDASADGLTLSCTEWGTGDKQGTLTADQSFWLEQWDGTDYTALTPASTPASGSTTTVTPGDTTLWQLTWSDTYGTLPSGAYRVGKAFTYTDPSGKTQSVTLYAKFRVFAEDMAPYVERCTTALEQLRTRHSYHLTLTCTPLPEEAQSFDYQYYTVTVWKNGDDFLRERRNVKADGSVLDHTGELYRDGVGYTLTWVGDDVLSGVASWETADYLDEMNRDLWHSRMQIFPALVGEVYAEGNTVHLLEGYSAPWLSETEWTKKSYTTDPSGNLLSARHSRVPGPEESEQETVYYTLEVHDTSAAEIASVIAAQSVDTAPAFSWVEEEALYPVGSPGVKSTGFANTTAQTVTLQTVISLAQKECTLEYQNTALVWHDEAAGVWKVQLGFSQDDRCQMVYLDDTGITLLVVTP